MDFRMPRLNKVIISGRITADPELKTTAKGTPVCRITIAVDRTTKKADGTYDNQASFLDVVSWSKQAETLNEKAHKGSPVIVDGHIEARSYTDNSGANRKAVEIIAEYIQFLERLDSADVVNNATSEPEPMPEQTGDDVPF